MNFCSNLNLASWMIRRIISIGLRQNTRLIYNEQAKKNNFTLRSSLLSSFFFHPLSTFYFFSPFNPSINLLNAPAVRSTGVA